MPKKYFTYLHPKKLNIRNNVKASMIQEFLFRLHGCLDCNDNSISSVYVDHWFNMIPLGAPEDVFTKWSRDRGEIPCLNVDCEWIQFMMIFYKKSDLFLLPGLHPNGYCKICQMASEGSLNRALLRIVNNTTVKILDKEN